MIRGRVAVRLVAWVAVGLVACGGKSSRSHRRDASASAGVATGAGAGGEASASGGRAGGGADPAGASGAGGSGGTGGNAGDGGSNSAGAGGTDPGAPGPTTFVLQNDTDTPLYVQVEFRQWLWVTVDGENVVLTSSCWCGEPSCPTLEPPLPEVAGIAAGESYAYEWDGYAAVWSESCYQRTVLRGDYAARFCYGTRTSPSANDFGNTVDDAQCQTVAFELGDARVLLRVTPPHPTTE
jgi:hypothetical protein